MLILREHISTRFGIIRNQLKKNMECNLGLNGLKQKQFKGFKIRQKHIKRDQSYL
jgi:hypothetical protein